MRNWKSVHIYYYDNQDFLILKGIYPVLKKYNISDFFFIRYWEYGPHVRLRLLNIDESTFENVKAEISKFINENASDAITIEEEYCRVSKEYYKKENIKNGNSSHMLPNNTLHNAKYIPETEKFYGRAGVAIAEDEFIYSTALALRVLHMAHEKKQKLYFGATFVCCLLNSAMTNGNEKGSFMKIYREYWERYAELNSAVKARMTANINSHAVNVEAINKIKHFYTINNFKKVYSSVFDKVAGLSSISSKVICDFTMNFIHLFNNRIGITPIEEIELIMMCEKIMEEHNEHVCF